jgi:hypothetical protein
MLTALTLSGEFHIVGWSASTAFTIMSAAFAIFKDDERRRQFGKLHESPPARAVDTIACALSGRGGWRPGSRSLSILFLILAIGVPVLGVLASNIVNIAREPIFFGVSGLVAAALAEWPESSVRISQIDKLYGKRVWKTDSRPTKSAPKDPGVALATVATFFGVLEMIVGGGLFYITFVRHLGPPWFAAIALGISFVAMGEAMSVSTTWLIVLLRGYPFVRTPSA